MTFLSVSDEQKVAFNSIECFCRQLPRSRRYKSRDQRKRERDTERERERERCHSVFGGKIE